MSGDVQVQRMELAGKRVLILGLARQGTALAHFLAHGEIAPVHLSSYYLVRTESC